MDCPSWRLTSLAIAVNALCSTFVGYHSSHLNLPSDHIKLFFNHSYTSHYGGRMSQTGLDSLWGFTVASALLVGIPFRLIGSLLLDRWGRKVVCTYFYGSLALASSLMMALAPNVGGDAGSFELFILGRILAGVAGAVVCTSVPVYVLECCQPSYRGLIGCMFPIFIGVGLILGVAVGHENLLGSLELWPFIFLLWAFPSLLIIAMGYFLPESPKYSYITKRNGFVTKAVLRKLDNDCNSTLRDDHYLAVTLASYREEHSQGAAGANRSIIAHLLNEDSLPGMKLSIVGSLGSASTGLVLKDFYSAELLRKAGLSDANGIFWVVIGSQAISLIGCLAMMPLVEKAGRRMLLLAGLAVSGFSMVGFLIFAYLDDYYPQPTNHGLPLLTYAAVFCFILLSFVNSIPPSIVSVLSVELVPQSARATNVALASVVECTCATVLLILYATLLREISHSALLLFVVPLLLCTGWLYWRLPETKGKNVNEIIKLLKFTNRSHPLL